MNGWKLDIHKLGISFETDRLRRDRQELIGELIVRCELPGAKTVNGCLATGDFNFSSVRARQDRAKLLAMRACTETAIDWYGYLEEFCQGVFERERQGDPAVDIWHVPMPAKADDFAVDGLAFPRRQPSILFGDGGSAKSYTALYIAGKLAIQGVAVAFFDWELAAEDHRERMERLFSAERPPLTYCRCEGPLTAEIDRLARVVRERKIQYAFFDSIAFACDGRPEEAESASRYYRAVRSLDIGSLHIAHINKSEAAELKPFGSNFWHNGARCTWFVKAEEGSGDHTLNLGFYHRKSNLGPLRKDQSLNIRFGYDVTRFERTNIADIPELAEKMKVADRIAAFLERGPMAVVDIAEELDIKVDTARKATKRSDRFVLIKGNAGEQDKVGLRAKVI